MKALKAIRVAVAACTCALVTLFFLGFGGGCGLLERVQIVPALLGCAVAPLVVWCLVAVLFGRLYCSMVCPLGILQDLLLGLARLCGRGRFAPRPDRPWIRWTALGVFTALVLCGGAALASLLDPYGTYGRFAAQLLQPAAEWANNLLADALGTDGAVVLFRRELFVRSASGFALAACSLALLAGLVAWKGRVLCNTVCPVGALLAGLAGRASLVDLAIDPAKCVKCGLCSGVCKAQCLDGRNQTLDNARCVRCFDCVGACAKGAISFGFHARPEERERRRFLRLTGSGVAGVVGGLFLSGARARVAGGSGQALPPPGATEASLRTKCTACGLCVARCPKQAIAPAGLAEYGPLGFMLPKMDFARGFCDPSCTACGAACPTGAIRLLDLAQKKTVKIGQAAFDRAACLACTEKIPCGLCARRCPQQAITLKEEEVKDGDKTVKIEVPSIDPAKCTGCGACEHYCPSHAMKVLPLS